MPKGESKMDELNKKNILLVDDSRTVRQFLKLVLSRYLHCEITEAEDGAQAVTHLSNSSGSFDLVITDINMPVMNGLSFIRKVRGELHMNVPIIIVTTMGLESDRDIGLELGANAYVTKPIKGPALIQEASSLL
jgi:two-component system chemotaxis response regulator CheY